MNHFCELARIDTKAAEAWGRGEIVERIYQCGRPASLRWYDQQGRSIWVCAECYDALEASQHPQPVMKHG
jgi:hypothetical protein